MAEGKLARSCLSECLRYGRVGADGGGDGGGTAAQGTSPGHQIGPPSKTTRSSRGAWSFGGRGCQGTGDVGSEIRQILSSECETDRSAVFGCSPPLRSCNPLCRDGQFRRCAVTQQPQGLYVPELLLPVKTAVDTCSAAPPHV